MKYVYILSGVLFLVILACSNLIIYYGDPPSPVKKEVDRVLSMASSEIERRYELRPFETGAAIPGDEVHKLCLAFMTNKVQVKDELRILLIDCANILLDQVNSSEKIEQYLVRRPFSVENGHIIIFNRDLQDRVPIDSQIDAAQMMRGKLDYFSIDPEDVCRYKNVYSETYDEALKIM